MPETDAACAEKLAAAGTVLIGKTTTHEFADGGPSFDLPWPPARNPWNPDHFTAGSSSGTGAGVAAGLILGGIGTDTGGSIRGPAALCGIAGIKPTYGLVSRAGVAPAAFSLDHIGPMAWTAEDCALMLQALAGHDPRDPASAERPIPDYTAQLGQGVKGLKIGVIHHFHEVDYKVSAGTRQGIDNAIATFRDLGAEIREVQLSPLQDWGACGLVDLDRRARRRLRGMGAHPAWRFQRAGAAPADARRLRLGRRLCAGGAAPARIARRAAGGDGRSRCRADCGAAERGGKDRRDPKWDTFAAPSFTMPFNVAGYPAISICSGFGEGGLPVAIQLVGKPFQEPTRVAHRRRLRKGHRVPQPPPGARQALARLLRPKPSSFRGAVAAGEPGTHDNSLQICRQSGVHGFRARPYKAVPE